MNKIFHILFKYLYNVTIFYFSYKIMLLVFEILNLNFVKRSYKNNLIIS